MSESVLRHRKGDGEKASVNVSAEKQGTASGSDQPRRSLEQRQIAISGIALAVIHILAWISGSEDKLWNLQYQTGEDSYDIGVNDWFFVVQWILLLIIIRAVCMDMFIKKMARHVNIHKQKAVQRFMEQGWSLIYYTVSFSYGLVLYYHSDYFLNCDALFVGWPHDSMSAYFKAYYLIQMASWFQQLVVLNIEERRKDHWQMFSHHIITICLVIGSYRNYFTRIGHLVLVIMDVVDILLPTAKMLKYCGFSTACDFAFGLFMLLWILLRHIAYNYVLWHAYTKARLLMNAKCELFAKAGIVPKICYTDFEIDLFVCLLAGLQVLMLIWMYLIARVAFKVISGKGADDVRSDDED